MSVIVKGMEIPKDYKYVDVRIFRDGTATTASAEEPFYKEMDVVEVPTPHGRLIDADALKLTAFADSNNFIHKMMVFGGQMVYSESAIDNAPTIIEAEGE